MTKWRREKTQINKIRDENRDITTNTNEIQRIIGEYFQNLNSSKLENQDKTGKFLHACNLPKLSQEYINHLKSLLHAIKLKQ
jgi:predicted transcriptional regulator